MTSFARALCRFAREPGKPHKFASTQINLDGPAADAIRRMGAAVADDELADDGREDQIHITTLFGLHPEVTADDVARAVADFGPVRYRLGRVSAFYGKDSGKDYDVLKVDVESPDLHRLHDTIAELPNTQSHAEYHPHATIAYVKAGLADNYIRRFPSLDVDGVADEIAFSDTRREQTPVPLGGGAKKMARTLNRLARGGDELPLRPGQTTPDGGKFEPDSQPADLGEFIRNQFADDYEQHDHFGHATGFLLPDGTPVQMGPDQRYEDHRAAIPTGDAMARWGWPEKVVSDYNESTRTPALVELMRRAGAARIHASDGMLTVHHASPLTGSQRRAITSHVAEYRPGTVIFEPHEGEEVETDADGDIEEAVRKSNRRLGQGRRRRMARRSAPVRYSHAAFHAAMHDNPHDTTPPLVYADYLEENGMPAHAEVIRRSMEGWRAVGGPGVNFEQHIPNSVGPGQSWGESAPMTRHGGHWLSLGIRLASHPNKSAYVSTFVPSADHDRLVPMLLDEGAKFPFDPGIKEKYGPKHLARDAEPRRLAAYRAPAGGTIVRGVFYQGGKLIPNLQKYLPRLRKVAGPRKPAPAGPVVSYAAAVNRMARAGKIGSMKFGRYDASPEDLAGMLHLLSQPEHEALRQGHGGDHTHRMIVSDALRENGRDAEADLLAEPARHVVVHDNQIKPGRWTLRHLHRAIRDFEGDGESPAWAAFAGPPDAEHVVLHDHTPAREDMHFLPSGVPAAWAITDGDIRHDYTPVHDVRDMVSRSLEREVARNDRRGEWPDPEVRDAAVAALPRVRTAPLDEPAA
jgi:uncharacterized protein (TIGR02996 family)